MYYSDVFFIFLWYNRIMIITFCGHSSFQPENRDALRQTILDTILKKINGEPVAFYLGGYGDFDEFAKEICVEYKKSHYNARLIFVTPYPDEKYLNKIAPLENGYDEILYADISSTPKRYAIPARNKWMVKESDLVIAYLDYPCGGAAQTIDYAKQIGKQYINFGREESY